MSVFDPLESLGFHCNLTFKTFASLLEQRLFGSGVSRVQFMALAHLIAFGTMPQRNWPVCSPSRRHPLPGWWTG